LPRLLLIAVGLALDAFAVCLGVATSGRARSARPIFRLSFHFGLFQFMMPVAGWYSGSHLARYIESWDHWVAPRSALLRRRADDLVRRPGRGGREHVVDPRAG